MKKQLILLLTYTTIVVSFISVLLLGSNIYDRQSFWVQFLMIIFTTLFAGVPLLNYWKGQFEKLIK
jgi:ABC-type arginine/histidine transport system permease subunit